MCGSGLDLYFDGVMPLAPSVTEPHPATHETLPVGFGHEFSGTVIEVGNGVTSLTVGDSVAVEPLLACNECPACGSGNYNICAKMGCIGIPGGGGGLSEAAHVLTEGAGVAADPTGPWSSASGGLVHGVTNAELSGAVVQGCLDYRFARLRALLPWSD